MSVPEATFLQVDRGGARGDRGGLSATGAGSDTPDVSPDPESQERMVRINQAWELLRIP